MPTTPIKVSLIEDHSGYRNVVSRALKKSKSIELISDFGTAEIAIRQFKSSNSEATPEVILLDLKLPGMSGLDAIPLFTHLIPEIKIIVITQSEKQADVLKSISLGAKGYVLKSSTSTQIIDSVLHIAGGGAILGPEIAHYILDQVEHQSFSALYKPLSAREMEILTLLSRGLIKKEIANMLNIGPDTVAFHVKHIYEKLEVRNAPEAVGKSYRLGILKKNS